MISRLWLSRILIGAVLFINIQSAVSFLIQPTKYAPAYELAGIPGDSAIRGFGVLFLMWNIPYIVAFLHPIKYQISLYESILMQSIGLVGESIIALGINQDHIILLNSIIRFVIFDGLGLIALITAALILPKRKTSISRSNTNLKKI